MRINVIVYIIAVGALMMGVFGLYATGELLGEMYSDPHEFESDYAVEGTSEGLSVSGTGHCRPLKENGSFYNYRFDVTVEDTDGNVNVYSFTVIFGSDEKPQLYTFKGSAVIEGQELAEYTFTRGSYEYSIYVGEGCHIPCFTISSDGFSIQGIIIR